MARVWVVILNWNQAGLTARCLDGVLAADGPRPAVVVVDNGSRPDDRRAVAAACGGRAGVEVVWLPTNRGFAGGMNAGIRRALAAGAEHVWVLNNDAFPDPGCLPALVAAMDADRRLAAVTPRLHGTDGGEQHAGGRITRFPCDHQVVGAADLAAPVSGGWWLTGTALLVRAAALRRVGLFDERLFAYYEDVDLSLRLTAAGYTLAAVPAAGCLHLESASTGGGPSPTSRHLIARNRFLLARKHLPRGRGMAGALWQTAVGLVEVGVFAARPDTAAAVVGGIWAGLLRGHGPPGRLRAPVGLEWAARLQPWWLARAVRGLAGAADWAGRPAGPAGP